MKNSSVRRTSRRTETKKKHLPVWLRRLDLVREEYRTLPKLSSVERSRQIFELMDLGIRMVNQQLREKRVDLSTWKLQQDAIDLFWKQEWKAWRATLIKKKD
jgi:hypothetical protein